jgi:hypothetical protein
MLKPGDELRRRLLDTMLQELVNAEAAAHIGAAVHERSDSRTTQCNGTLDKLFTTGVGPSRSRPEDPPHRVVPRGGRWRAQVGLLETIQQARDLFSERLNDLIT